MLQKGKLDNVEEAKKKKKKRRMKINIIGIREVRSEATRVNQAQVDFLAL